MVTRASKDPGALVSRWYALDLDYKKTQQTLEKISGSMNSIRETLLTKGITLAARGMTDTAEYVSASSWEPPTEQHPIQVGSTSTTALIDSIQRDAYIMEDSNLGDFAGNQMANIMQGLKGGLFG